MRIKVDWEADVLYGLFDEEAELEVAEEATIRQDGTLENLPFHAGEVVEVIVLAQSNLAPRTVRYSLRGEPIRYVAPPEPVAQAEWEVER